MGNELKQVGTLRIQCWETKTIHAFYEGGRKEPGTGHVKSPF